MYFTLIPLLAGFLGVVGCLGSMLLPRALGIAHVDVVRASGEFIMKRYETAFVPGLLLHSARASCSPTFTMRSALSFRCR